MLYQSQLHTWDLSDARVILRADLNVPINNGSLVDDSKLKTLQPTLDCIIKQAYAVTLLTHIGNPKNPDPAYSTQLLIPWFEQRKYTIVHAAHVNDILPLLHKIKKGTIILCENMRFFAEETQESIPFAEQLKECGDFYVNDGFAVMHRSETSVTVLPTLFTLERKTIGFYTENELNKIDSIMTNAKKPIIACVGGKKIKSKLPILYDLIDRIDALIICPALSFTFLKAQGYEVGKSLIDETALDACHNLYQYAQQKQVNIILPLDFYVSYNGIQEPYSLVSADAIPKDANGISIGPKTNTSLADILKKAQTIIYNGAMGFLEKPASLEGMHILMQTIAQTNAKTLITGGDTVAALHYFGMQSQFTHISLGGGATLFYIAHKTLPGLQALNI